MTLTFSGLVCALTIVMARGRRLLVMKNVAVPDPVDWRVTVTVLVVVAVLLSRSVPVIGRLARLETTARQPSSVLSCFRVTLGRHGAQVAH